MTDTEMILEQLKGMQEKMDGMQASINNLRNDMGDRLENVNQRIDGLDRRMDGLEQQMEDFKSDMLEEFRKQNGTLDEKTAEIDDRLENMARHLKVYMESSVGIRITALAEGFEANQGYIDRNRRIIRRTQEQLDRLETRVSVPRLPHKNRRS